ncbi:hypothetical protein [uncultured Aquitalea sp.]|uniref:hypothetical protein n=1 Tax=uncultured Aquitalea sp. TaxID=540272 RepID=UPI0025F0C069|nr:hypothetical protein [uncultured Aquitalea sp.]
MKTWSRPAVEPIRDSANANAAPSPAAQASSMGDMKGIEAVLPQIKPSLHDQKRSK